MTAIRLIPALVLAFAASGALTDAAAAAKHVAKHEPKHLEQVPLPRVRPAAIKPDASARTAAHTSSHKGAILSGGPAAPMVLIPDAPQASMTASIPASGVLGYDNSEQPGRHARVSPPTATPASPARRGDPSRRPAAAFAVAATSSTSPLDMTAVKQAIDLTHKGRRDEATGVEATISDPLARKLVEWAILRGDDGPIDFARYAAFIAANPSWPGVRALRRHAEVALWQQQVEPRTVLAFFNNEPPLSAKGQLALARALLAAGDRAGAQAMVREAWSKGEFSADLEAQARGAFADLITPADDKARMDARLYAEDEDAAMRAASHLDPVEHVIAQARAAVFNKSSKAKALLEAVPPAARHDPGYMFSRIQWLRRNDKIAEAAQWMLAAPREPERIGDADQWWVERRLIARKLLDLGDVKAAYEIASAGAPSPNENHRAEQQFTAGWIALRFLREPGTALPHFARIAAGVTNPITLARSYYWQGRAAEALGRSQEARSHYDTAAQYPTAYYGQLARARLRLDTVALYQPPEPPAEARRLEIVRAFELLYAIDERDIVASMASDIAEHADDAGALAALAEITTRHHDARATLLIGKIALGRGLPLDHYAFPDFGVPNYQQIGPEVERCVVYSIVRQESAFNPRVVSSANAIGLMQVTPAAGRDTAKRSRVSFDQGRLMNDTVYNAQLGTAELGNDIASWRGSYVLAFVAYNAGPRRAKEWIEQYGDPRDPKVDPVDWIERIPVSETRNYVQRVIENMQVYRARLDNDSRLLIEADLRRGG